MDHAPALEPAACSEAPPNDPPHPGRTPPPGPAQPAERDRAHLAGAVMVVVVLLQAPFLDTGPFVPRLTVDNPTRFDINVDLASGDRRGWIHLGTVGRESQSVLEEIADPGATWVFRLSYAGVEVGELVVPRSDLRAAGWRLDIPADVGSRIADAGFTPSVR